MGDYDQVPPEESVFRAQKAAVPDNYVMVWALWWELGSSEFSGEIAERSAKLNSKFLSQLTEKNLPSRSKGLSDLL